MRRYEALFFSLGGHLFKGAKVYKKNRMVPLKTKKGAPSQIQVTNAVKSFKDA
jgi:hypothetical protein